MKKLLGLSLAIACVSCSSELTPQPSPQATNPSPVASPTVKPSPSQPPKPLTLEQKAERFRLQFYKEVEKLGSGITTKYAVTTMQKWEEQPSGVEAGFENTCQETREFKTADDAAQSAYDANQGTIPLNQLQLWYKAKFAAIAGLCK